MEVPRPSPAPFPSPPRDASASANASATGRDATDHDSTGGFLFLPSVAEDEDGELPEAPSTPASSSSQHRIRPRKKGSSLAFEEKSALQADSMLPPLTPSAHDSRAFAQVPRTPGSILRRKDVLGAGAGAGPRVSLTSTASSSVRFGKRLYDDGQESSMSMLSVHSAASMSSASVGNASGSRFVRPGTAPSLLMPEDESVDQISGFLVVTPSTSRTSILPLAVLQGPDSDVSLNASSSAQLFAGGTPHRAALMPRVLGADVGDSDEEQQTPHPRRIAQMRVSRPSLQDAQARALRRAGKPGFKRAGGDDDASDADGSVSSRASSASSSGSSARSGSARKHGDASPTRSFEHEAPAAASTEHREPGDESAHSTRMADAEAPPVYDASLIEDMPDLESLSNIMDASADVEALSQYYGDRTHGGASSSGKRADAFAPRLSGRSSVGSAGGLTPPADDDESLSLSLSTLQREVKGFQDGWAQEEEKEKSRRMSMGAAAARGPAQAQRSSPAQQLMQQSPAEDQEVQARNVATPADASLVSDTSELLPTRLPLPPSPNVSRSMDSSFSSGGSSLQRLENSPTVRAGPGTQAYYSSPLAAAPIVTASPQPADEPQAAEESQLPAEPQQRRQSPQSTSQVLRPFARPGFLHRHSTPLEGSPTAAHELTSPGSSPVGASPSTQRLGRRDAGRTDLRRHLAVKALVSSSTPAPNVAARSPSPALSRIGSPLRFDTSTSRRLNRSSSSVNASVSRVSGSAYFDADDTAANLSAVLETARELDEVHTERTAHLLERLQQGDNEILELRQTLQRVSSAEVETQHEYERLKQRAEAAELALLREKEEAFAAARLQDQQHAEVAALIDRLKSEIDQQQLELEARLQEQSDQQAMLQDTIVHLEAQIRASEQQRHQEERDFEVRLHAARAEEQRSAAEAMQTAVDQTAERTRDSCERDFAIRLAREVEDLHAANAQLQDKLAITEEQLASTRDEHDSMRQDRASKDELALQAQHELERVEAELAGERAASQAAAAELAQVKDALADLQYHARGLELKVDEMEEALGQTQRDKARAQRDAQSAREVEQQLLATHERDAQRIADLERQVQELSVLQVQQPAPCMSCQSDSRNVQMNAASKQELAAAQKRISTLESEVANRGIDLARLRKKQQQLEQDNRNYGIALSAKQAELNMLRRNGGIRYALPRTPLDKAVPNTIKRLGLESGSPTLGVVRAPPAPIAFDEGELSKGPAELKARRRRSIDLDNGDRASALARLMAPTELAKDKESAGRSPARKASRRMQTAA